MVPGSHDSRLLVEVMCEVVDCVTRTRAFARVTTQDVSDAETLHAFHGGFCGTVRPTSITVVVVVFVVDHLQSLQRLEVIVAFFVGLAG